MDRRKNIDLGDPDKLYPDQAAALIGVTDRTIRNAVRAGRLIAHSNTAMRRGSWYVYRWDVLRLSIQRQVPASSLATQQPEQ